MKLELFEMIKQKKKRKYCECCETEKNEYFHPLCEKCRAKFNSDQIKRCNFCGKWNKANQNCDCEMSSIIDKDIISYREEQKIVDEFRSCEYCGKPTHDSTSALCPVCSLDLDNKKIKKCIHCGCYNDNTDVIVYKTTGTSRDAVDACTMCTICGAASNGKPQCLSCYNETRSIYATIDPSKTVHDTRDYYYNLREHILKANKPDQFKSGCNKLIALALFAEKRHKDNSLKSRVFKDIKEILQSFFDEKQSKAEEATSAVDLKPNMAQDGHAVKSNVEVIIDDILYHEYILHCYEKPISEIIEKRKKSDWFIPILNGKGIYIEYWGMETAKYQEDRAEKEELYKKYDIPYIGIEKDEPKKDTLTFTNNLKRQIETLAIKRFGFMPEWKK